MKVSVYSNTGKKRQDNQDNYYVDSDSIPCRTLAVADGMGGHRAGDVASRIAVEYIENNPVKPEDLSDTSEMVFQIKSLINKANQQIIDSSRNNVEYEDMGTTLSLGVVCNQYFHFGHVGDSRIYLFRDNTLHQLTTDHSLVNQLVSENRIKPEEAFNHPQKNILTQALGVDRKLEIDTGSLMLKPGDHLLFCTDGLTDMIRFTEIEQVFEEYQGQIDRITEILGKRAMDYGGEDNITLITGIIN
ncbi:MAG: Stp1/IreP family PP2C-type Ser/Thr phosphatase [Bacillota bacterium]